MREDDSRERTCEVEVKVELRVHRTAKTARVPHPIKWQIKIDVIRPHTPFLLFVLVDWALGT